MVKLGKLVLLLIAVELSVFSLMILFVMSDESTSDLGKSLYFMLKYIMGFPLVLINKELPFFLESKQAPLLMIPLVLVNNLIQAIIILSIHSLVLRRR